MQNMSFLNFLKWVFCDELPKDKPDGGGLPSSGGLMDDYSKLMAVVDNRYGVVTDFYSSGDPHPLAVFAFNFLQDEESQIPNFQPSKDLCSDFPADFPFEKYLPAIKHLVFSGDYLRYGILTRARSVAYNPTLPQWRGDIPTKEMVLTKNGKPAWFRKENIDISKEDDEPSFYEFEVDGWNEKTRRPYRGAYHKFTWKPDPVELLTRRYELFCFCEAMNRLIDAVNAQVAGIYIYDEARTKPWKQ